MNHVNDLKLLNTIYERILYSTADNFQNQLQFSNLAATVSFYSCRCGKSKIPRPTVNAVGTN